MSFKRKIKNILHSFTHFFGIQISQYPPQRKMDKRDVHYLRLLKKFNIDLVLDVGAAHGEYSRWLFDIGYENKILAFEPLEEQYNRLAELFAGNPRLEVAERCALGNEEKQIVMNVSANLDSSSALQMKEVHVLAAPHSHTKSSETVPQRKLDSFKDRILRDSPSVFLKIDVQGYEKFVLEGAELILPRIKGIQVEMSLVSLYEGQALFDELYSIIKAKGFELFYVRPGFADLEGRLLQFDAIFFKV